MHACTSLPRIDARVGRTNTRPPLLTVVADLLDT
jgi:hypothetical protein